VAQARLVYAATSGRMNPDCKTIGSCVPKAVKAWPGCVRSAVCIKPMIADLVILGAAPE